MRDFVYGEFDTSEIDDLYVKNKSSSTLERDFSSYEILGKDGDYIIDNGRNKNYDITYNIRCMSITALNAFKTAFVGVVVNYTTLTDDADTEAVAYVKSVSITPMKKGVYDCSVTFSCKGGVIDDTETV